MQRVACVALAAACLWAEGGVFGAQESASARPLVIVGEIDGIIHPIAAEYVDDVFKEADSSNADAVILVLRTPGGLLESTRTIVSRIIGSRAPVVVFVGPSGARAASAGFFLTIAADVAAMARGTHIGAAHPVTGTGQQVDKTEAEKAASDAAAYVRSLAAARGRNATLSEQAVKESRAFTETEALQASPPLVDFLAADLNDVLRQLDGRSIRRFNGASVTLRTAGADVRRVEMSRRQRFLSGIAHPQIAYLLMTLGILGLTVELWNPGTILPGIAGGFCLLMAFFAFQILPVNVVGLVLFLFGASLLVAELFVPSFGMLGIGGALALLFGSILLTDTVPGVRINYDVIIPVVAGFVGISVFLGRLAVRAQRQRPVTGVESLVGETGITRSDLAADSPGQIDVHGEIWRAVSRVPLGSKQIVRVTNVDGLTLHVEPVHPSATEGGASWKSPPG